MTTELPGDAPLEERVANLELEVGRLRERVLANESGISTAAADSSAARTLAAGADRDVSEVRAELRAHLQALNALRETQREMGQQLRVMDQQVRAMDQRMERGFATVKVGIDEIAELLRGREERG